jgi:glucoamylase
MIRLARLWLKQGQEDRVRQKLYDGKLPANTLIKADLEYVAHHWGDTGFDLWEEVSGHHFFTRMAQRQALIEGAQLAGQLGDGGAASYYQQQAEALETEIGRFWDPGRGYLVETLDWNGGANYKNSGIDSAVILGVIHGETADGFLSASSDKVLATVLKQEQAFQNAFPINGKGLPGIAIGRYPEDHYSGTTNSSEGNPWLLTTMAFGELYYRAANEFESAGKIGINATNAAFFQSLLGAQAPAPPATLASPDPQFTAAIHALRARGDAYLNRGHYHGEADGHYAEQINRYTGYMQSAADLTWSYASYLTAYWSRTPSK